MYGLIKIHKTGNPIRPIVASRGSLTYNLPREFSDILRNVVRNTNRSVKNSAELRERVKNIKIPKNYTLVSSDVKSLFTNIPNELVYEAVKKRWRNISRHTDLPLDKFIEGRKLVLENNYFEFNGTFYVQISGSPMSPVIADLVLEILEEIILGKFMFEVPFFIRYVDDIVTAIPSNKIDLVVETFNTYNEKIQFTFEK